MSNQAPVLLNSFYRKWGYFQESLQESFAPVTDDQLVFRAVETQRTVAEIAQHLIASRACWFHEVLGEGSAELAPYVTWDFPGAPTQSIQEVLRGLELSGDLMRQCFDRWTAVDLEVIFNCDLGGAYFDLPRAWFIAHVLEHDFILGGEISVLLGIQGLKGPGMYPSPVVLLKVFPSKSTVQNA
jgi:DinB family protein